MNHLILYENFKANAVEQVNKNVFKVHIQNLADEMFIMDEDTGEYKDKYETRFVDYIDNLLVGKYVTYKCIECQGEHSGILEKTYFEEDDIIPSDLVRVKFKLHNQEWDMFDNNDHMVDCYTPVIVNKIGATANRFDL